MKGSWTLLSGNLAVAELVVGPVGSKEPKNLSRTAPCRNVWWRILFRVALAPTAPQTRLNSLQPSKNETAFTQSVTQCVREQIHKQEHGAVGCVVLMLQLQ
jgi:hypothetical protein